MTAKTEPIDPGALSTASRLAIAATYQDPVSKALYVHTDLEEALAPWADEGHIRPMSVTERFGDVESFVSYVQRYGTPACTLLTWNAQGLHAVLDYAESPADPGRRTWQATHPFKGSHQWQAWMALANGQPVAQRAAVERLEDLAEDIIEPAPADLMALLRSLRATVNATADTELRPDGTTSVMFTRNTTVKSGSGIERSVDIPPSFSIAIPVLKGHVNGEGGPVLYRLQVRLRVSPDDSAHLALRFSIPNAERTLEHMYADRVALAADRLGEGFELLRAAD